MLGPQQVQTKIAQHTFLSGQLTLWDQQGSKVMPGNVLAILLDNTLLYVAHLICCLSLGVFFFNT